jgi:hypothetical protein
LSSLNPSAPLNRNLEHNLPPVDSTAPIRKQSPLTTTTPRPERHGQEDIPISHAISTPTAELQIRKRQLWPEPLWASARAFGSPLRPGSLRVEVEVELAARRAGRLKPKRSTRS